MKRTILCAAAVTIAAVSCQKSVEPANPVEEGKGTIDISINGLMGEYTMVDGTKASLMNNVRVSWEGGETVYVYDRTQCLGSLVASTEGTEDRYAVLSTNDIHTVSTPTVGTTTLTLVYSPLLTEAPAISKGAISISLASQSGEKAPFVAFATLEYTSTTITGAVVPFQFATSVIKVNCTGLKSNTAITSATLSNVNTKCKLTISGTSAPTVSGDTNGIIARTGDKNFAASKINAEGESVFQIAVPSLEAASKARVLTVTQGLEKVKDEKFTTKSLDPATSVNTVCQLTGLPADALPGNFTINAEGKTIHFSKGNLYYDGSNWGFEAEQYYFRTYKGHCKCDAGGYDRSGTASNHWGLFGWSSDKAPAKYGITTATLNSGDFIDWGTAIDSKGTWTTLSGGYGGEWMYLLNKRTVNNGTGKGKSYKNATIQLDKSIGVSGIILYPDGYTSQTNVTSYTITEWKTMETNGCVFLPAAGYRIGSNVLYVGSYGYYWSSTAYADSDVYSVGFDHTEVYPAPHGECYRGHSVRLITGN